MLIAGNVEGPMLERLRNGRCPTWLLGLFSLAILSGSGISALGQDTDTASAKLAAAGVGGQYFIEFRARYAWDTPLSCTAGSVSLSRKRASPAFLQ